MSDVAIFVVGAVVFSITTVATLLFGYLRMAELYERQRAEEPEPAES